MAGVLDSLTDTLRVILSESISRSGRNIEKMLISRIHEPCVRCIYICVHTVVRHAALYANECEGEFAINFTLRRRVR